MNAMRREPAIAANSAIREMTACYLPRWVSPVDEQGQLRRLGRFRARALQVALHLLARIHIDVAAFRGHRQQVATPLQTQLRSP